MNIFRHLITAGAFLTCFGCSGSYKYVPLKVWPKEDSISSREVTTTTGSFRCESGFEYEGPLEYQENGGKYHTIIPQMCSRVIPRKRDLLVVTTTYVDTLKGIETTLWSVNQNQALNPNSLFLTKLPGLPCGFRRREEGIEFELVSVNPETNQCVLVTTDNIIHTAGCGTKKVQACMI